MTDPTQDRCTCGQTRGNHTTPHPFVAVAVPVNHTVMSARIADQCIRSLRNMQSSREDLKAAALALIARLEGIMRDDT